MINFCDFIQVFVFTTNHHLNANLHKAMNSDRSIVVLLFHVKGKQLWSCWDDQLT